MRIPALVLALVLAVTPLAAADPVDDYVRSQLAARRVSVVVAVLG